MRYANGDGYLRHHRAMQQCEVLPLELTDRTQGSDKVYLQLTLLTFLQSISHSHLLQNFDWKD
jgi:hypothetical protein